MKDLDDSTLKKAADLIKSGELVVFPTETVYGLGADVFNEKAIEKIYELKQRKKDKGLIVHLSKIEDVEKVACDIPDIFYLLAKEFFPGPLTIILKRKPNLPKNISPNDTIAVRMPDCRAALKFIDFVQNPIVGTSANISTQKPPINADQVLDVFEGKIGAIIDAGECRLKVPSTVISILETPFKILREGEISKDDIEKVLKS